MSPPRGGILLVALISMLGAAGPSVAQSDFQVLHDFSGYSHATGPWAPLTEGSDGLLYGTTYEGGRFNLGTIFRISRTGGFELLHDFEGSDGMRPAGPLLLTSDGSVYGTTRGNLSGTPHFGNVFRLARDGTLSVLHVFNRVDGAFPLNGLILGSDGAFYGTTESGGGFGQGTVFRMTVDGALTTLHHFAGGALDGASPSVILQAPDGVFYGITEGGGSAPCVWNPSQSCQYGTAYRMMPDGSLTIIHHFGRGTEGVWPQTLLLASDGNFIGATDRTAYGLGTIFRMAFDGSVGVLRPLDGGVSGQVTLLEGRDGVFYGTNASGTGGSGDIFRVTPDGVWSHLHKFRRDADGAYPIGALRQAGDGSFYGTTSLGGPSGFGTVFRMDAAGAVTVLHAFASTEGAAPEGALVEASDGSFYGTTEYGGIYNRGTIYRLTREGQFQTVYTFSGAFDGGRPIGTLLQASDGHLYGTTSVNGAYDQGVLYRFTLDGTFRTLHAFNRALDAATPSGGLVQGSDGLLYGTTRSGGTGQGSGTVFRSTLDGDVTVLHSFAGGSDGSQPGPLVLGADGSFYGKTSQYAAVGTVFRMTRAGVDTIVHRFTESTSHGTPSDVMVRGADGNVYGNFGCNGGIFRFGPSGFTVLTLLGGSCIYDFGPPVVHLAAGTDGLLYAGVGTSIYAVNLGGFASVIHRDSVHGWSARLLQATNGHLYGAAEYGGVFGGGRLFRLTPKPTAPLPLVVAPAGGATVQLTWTATANAASYTIRRGTTSGGEVVLATGIKGLRFLDTSVIKGQRVYYTITAVNQFGESVASYEVSMTPGRAVVSDFDGDGVSDPAVFRPSTGAWHVMPNASPVPWGGSDDVPVAADYTGDGIVDIAVFRPTHGVWHVRGWGSVAWGGSGDIPVPGYYRGGEAADIAVFRPSSGTWYIRGLGAIPWGGAGDVPVPGDYDGDGVTDVAVFRPSNFTWYIRYAAGGGASFPWGSPTDNPVPGDYDGDGRTDVAVYRPARLNGPCCIQPGAWYVLPSGLARDTFFRWGDIGDMPVAGDYDGDGQADVAVFRSSTGEWYILRSGPRTGIRHVWGGSGDVPISDRH